MMAILLGGSLALQVVRPPADFHDVERLVLKAIIQTESKGNAHAVGKAGERGLFQFTKKTWEFHTKHSFDHAFNSAYASVIARKHLDWILDQFDREHISSSPIDIYIVWNAGFEYYHKRQFKKEKVAKSIMKRVEKFNQHYMLLYGRN